ncbi:MAG: hypothetical protein HAW66_01000 [Shewanella sp.]|nr:hypothetical protein [Shewanella sp.]
MSLPTTSSYNCLLQKTGSLTSEHNDQKSVLEHRNTSINDNTYQLRRATSVPSLLKISNDSDQSTTNRTISEFFIESIANIDLAWQKDIRELLNKVTKTGDMQKNAFSKLEEYHVDARQQMSELNAQCLEFFEKLSSIDEHSDLEEEQSDYRAQLEDLTISATQFLFVN